MELDNTDSRKKYGFVKETPAERQILERRRMGRQPTESKNLLRKRTTAVLENLRWSVITLM